MTTEISAEVLLMIERRLQALEARAHPRLDELERRADLHGLTIDSHNNSLENILDALKELKHDNH